MKWQDFVLTLVTALLSVTFLAQSLPAQTPGQTGGPRLILQNLGISVAPPADGAGWSPTVAPMPLFGVKVNTDVLSHKGPGDLEVTLSLWELMECAQLMDETLQKKTYVPSPTRIDNPPYLPPSWPRQAWELPQDAAGHGIVEACYPTGKGAVLATVFHQGSLVGPAAQSVASLLDAVATALQQSSAFSKAAQGPQAGPSSVPDPPVSLTKTGLRVLLPSRGEKWTFSISGETDLLEREKPILPFLEIDLIPWRVDAGCERLLAFYAEKMRGTNQLVNAPPYLPAGWPPLAVHSQETSGNVTATVCHATSSGAITATISYDGDLSSPQARTTLAPILEALAKAADAR